MLYLEMRPFIIKGHWGQEEEHLTGRSRMAPDKCTRNTQRARQKAINCACVLHEGMIECWPLRRNPGDFQPLSCSLVQFRADEVGGAVSVLQARETGDSNDAQARLWRHTPWGLRAGLH